MPTVPAAPDPVWVLRGALTRVVVIRESIDDGRVDEAARIARDLEDEVAGSLSRLTEGYQ